MKQIGRTIILIGLGMCIIGTVGVVSVGFFELLMETKGTTTIDSLVTCTIFISIGVCIILIGGIVSSSYNEIKKYKRKD